VLLLTCALALTSLTDPVVGAPPAAWCVRYVHGILAAIEVPKESDGEHRCPAPVSEEWHAPNGRHW
jgi:hypothetical protein